MCEGENTSLSSTEAIRGIHSPAGARGKTKTGSEVRVGEIIHRRPHNML